jgi:histidinol-phosphatase (PHP family)
MKKSWANYHGHSIFCDGTDVPENYLKEAMRLGLHAYGFSAHAPVPFKTDWCLPDERLAEYLAEIGRLKEKYIREIQIYLGLEIDFIPGVAGRAKHLNGKAVLDYFIGSIHFVESFADGEHWNIDTSAELFQRGMKEIFNNHFQKAATRFWELTRRMIEEDRPPVIGHLDKIKMFNARFNLFHESEAWYRDQVELTLKTIKKYGCIVEVNTRGCYRYHQPDLYPGEWIISRLDAEGIPLLISSDAHKPEEIIRGMDYAAAKLKNLGIEHITALNYSKWEQFPYSAEGIEFPDK